MEARKRRLQSDKVTQIQWLIHTTIEPLSFGCLDKLTPSHWLSRSSKQVFPQRSPLGLPRRQGPMLWTEGEVKNNVVANRSTQELWGDNAVIQIWWIWPPSLSYTGHVDFLLYSWAKVWLWVAKGSIVALNVIGWQGGLASPSLLRKWHYTQFWWRLSL